MISKKKIYCTGCANLFVVGSFKVKASSPMCVATAEFVAGPLRKKINVIGVEDAVIRNIRNDCVCRASVSLHAWELKRWLLWRLNNGGKKEIGEVNLKGYPVDSEQKFKNRIIESFNRKKSSELSEEEVDSLIRSVVREKTYTEETSASSGSEEAAGEKEETTDEDVRNDGGTGNNDKSDPTSELGGEVIQDT